MQGLPMSQTVALQSSSRSREGSQPPPEKLGIEGLYKQLSTSAGGLSSAEAKARLEKYGPNALAEKKTSAWAMFGKFFWGPMPWMIELAAIVSLLLKDWLDFIIIISLLLFNAVLGFWHEREASNALDALKGSLAQEAQALRDGKWQTIQAATLVPGDMVRIRLGNVVPADVTLAEGEYLDVDQAALTGESLPVTKKTGDDAYSGSVVKKGVMTALVTGTGSNTFFGRTAGLVQTAGVESNFEKINNQIGDYLIILAVILAVIMIASQLHHGDDFLHIGQYALLLLVAAIPVAMPAVLSMTMAMGARALASEKAIVSRLEAIEELAAIEILFSDKTGTLTQNKLTLGPPALWGSARAEDAILAAALASKEEDKDPIDQAVLQALKDPGALKAYKQITFVPFDPVSKRTEATIQDPSGKQFKVSKGMPPVIFELAKLSGADLKKAQDLVAGHAAKGDRALACARADGKDDWVLLAILPMSDPPRPDSKETIARANAYGVQVKMVTGDDVAIAKNIAESLGMGSNIVAAADIFTGDVTKGEIPRELAERVVRAQGFGRVFPEHKWAIVKSAQQLGKVVGMTGDGVNDAPALKQANVGTAVSGATEAARAAAGVILTAPGLSTIIRGIEEARRTFLRMLGYAFYRIAMTVNIMLFIVLVMVLYHFPVLTPIMIILLALLDDVPVMLVAFDNVPVDPHPSRWNMRRLLVGATLFSLLGVIQSSGMLRYLHRGLGIPEGGELQTAMFLQLVVAGHLLLLSTRTRKFFFLPPFPEPRFFLAILGTQVLAALMAANGWLVPPIPWKLIGLIWAYNLVWMVVIDLVKVSFIHRWEEREAGRLFWQRALHRPLDAHEGLSAA
jgi:H+-transporting ATPase